MDNPYIGMAGGMAESAMSSAASVARSLRSALEQQQQMQEEKRKQGLAEQLDMARLMNEGWQVYEPQPLAQNSAGRPTLMQGGGSGEVNVPPPTPQNMVTLPTINKQLYRPSQTPQEQRQATQQTFTDTKEMYDKGARPIDSEGNVAQHTDIPRFRDTSIVSPDGRLVQAGPAVDTGRFGTFGAVESENQARVQPVPGGQSFYRPSDDEVTAGKLREKVQQTIAEHAAQGGALNDDVASFLEKRAGRPPGSLHGQLPAGALQKAFDELITPDKAEKPDVQSIIPGYTGAGGGPVIYDKTTRSSSELTLPRGAKRVMTPYQEQQIGERKQRDQERTDAAPQKLVDANQKIIDAMRPKLDQANVEAVRQQGLAKAYNDAMMKQVGERYIDPMDKRQAQVPMDKEGWNRMVSGLRQAKVRQAQAQKAAAAYQNEIEERQGRVDDAQRRIAARLEKAAPGGQQSQSQAQSRGQLTDVNVARQYLQRAGGDKVRAQALAKADGWEF